MLFRSIQNPHTDLAWVKFQLQALVGVQRGEILEHDLLVQDRRVTIIDGLDPQQGKILFIFLGGPDLAGNNRTISKAKSSDL